MTPKKDTLIICLPQEWVGKPLVCVLQHPDEKETIPLTSEYVSELREDHIGYLTDRYRLKRQRPRKKRLRRKRGGITQYL